MANKAEKILSQINQDPTQSRLVAIAKLIDDLKKKKKDLEKDMGLMASMADLEKREEIDLITSEISRLEKEKKGLKSGKLKVADLAPLEVKIEIEKPKEKEVVTSVVVETQEPKEVKPEVKETPEPILAPVTEVEPVKTTEPELVPEKISDDSETIAEINKLKEEKRQNRTAAIKYGKGIGQSKEALILSGLDKNLVDEIYDEKEGQDQKSPADQGKMGVIMQQIMMYMENEKKDNEEYEQERQQDLEKIEANEAKLAELLELREKLAEEEGKNEEPSDEEGGSGMEGEGDKDENDKEEPVESEEERNERIRKEEKERYKIDESASENIQKMQRMIIKYRENRRTLDTKFNEFYARDDKNHGWKIWKYMLPDMRKRKLNKEINELKTEQEELEENFEKCMKAEFPVTYYAVEKIKDPDIRKLFMAKGKNGPYISMRSVRSIGSFYSTNIHDPSYSYISDYKNGMEIYPDGFVVKIINKDQISDEWGDYSAIDPLARYNIIDPNGKIILENADRKNIFKVLNTEVRWPYEKQVAEEWYNLNKK